MGWVGGWGWVESGGVRSISLEYSGWVGGGGGFSGMGQGGMGVEGGIWCWVGHNVRVDITLVFGDQSKLRVSLMLIFEFSHVHAKICFQLT